MGRRTDSEVVQLFVAPLGRKLKPTTDNDSFGSFDDPASGLFLAWSHILRLPRFYPPVREKRLNVCYVTGISFDPRRVQDLPFGLTASSTASEIRAIHASRHPGAIDLHTSSRLWIPLPDHPDQSLSIGISHADVVSADWSVQLIEYECYSRLRTPSFTPWHEEWPLEQADLATGFFMAWCIRRGFVGERHLLENNSLVEAVRRGTMTGREFLYEATFADEFWSWDIRSDLRDFTRRYVFGLCQRESGFPLGDDEGSISPSGDFVKIFDPFFPGRSLDAADDASNFERFALLVDARWADYGSTAFRGELTEATAAELGPIYGRQLELMAERPAPLAAQFSSSHDVLPVTTPELIALLGLDLDHPQVVALLTRIGGRELAEGKWDRSIDLPQYGLRILLGYPWERARRESEFDAAAKKSYRRKQRWMVNGLTFSQEGDTAWSYTASRTFSYSAYPGDLPLALRMGDSVQSLDSRFGPDSLDDRDEGDGALTRRWEITSAGDPIDTRGDQPHFLLLVRFADHSIRNVCLAYR